MVGYYVNALKNQETQIDIIKTPQKNYDLYNWP